jgi:hypothetical protein
MAAKKKKKGQSKKPKKPAQPQPAQPIEGKAEVVDQSETGNGMTGLIKASIIVSTFVTIAVLSVFSQGADDTSPGVGVVIIRFALLSACAVIYFLMLYLTRVSRQKSDQKPSRDKK